MFPPAVAVPCDPLTLEREKKEGSSLELQEDYL